jgi:hypothetical protein
MVKKCYNTDRKKMRKAGKEERKGLECLRNAIIQTERK